MTKKFFNQAAASLHHHYGTKAQIAKAIEEICELARVLQPALSWPKDWSITRWITDGENDLISEIADVLNTVENLANIIGREQVDGCREAKMRRALQGANTALDLTEDMMPWSGDTRRAPGAGLVEFILKNEAELLE